MATEANRERPERGHYVRGVHPVTGIAVEGVLLGDQDDPAIRWVCGSESEGVLPATTVSLQRTPFPHG